MLTTISKKITANITGILAICCLILFGGLQQPEHKHFETAAGPCCRGYSITMDKLRQFMLDSLKTGSFEGGVYSKTDLLKAINGVSGDSVYIMNALINCVLNQGNGMFVTSPTTGEVRIISRNPYCAPCPGKPCCPQRICASVINRACLNYKRVEIPGEIATSE